MGKVSITFNTNNEQFSDDKLTEVSKVLKNVAKKIEGGSKSGNIADCNGNNIGKYSVS